MTDSYVNIFMLTCFDDGAAFFTISNYFSYILRCAKLSHTKYWICRDSCKSNMPGKFCLPRLRAQFFYRYFLCRCRFLPSPPLPIPSRNTVPHPPNMMSAVVRTPWYCPPKNNAVIASRDNRYNPPAIMHTASLRRLIAAQATVAPIMDEIRSSARIPYPIRSQGIVSELTSFARITDSTSVKAILKPVPSASPAGMESALPVTLRLTVMLLSPFPFILFPVSKKRTRTGGNLSWFYATITVYTSTSTFFFRCSCASVTARNFIRVSRTSSKALETTSSV